MSQWGHDFRPDYFRLADAARWLGADAIVASTATATPQVAADIVARLGLRDPVHVATGFDRPNLSFAVVPCANKDAVHRGIAAALAEPGALPGIVYAGTRAESERLAGRLADAAGRGGDRLPRGPAARRARGGPAPLHGRRGAGRGRHQRVRHGHRQGRRAHGLPRDASRARSRRTTRRPAAQGATGSRRAACVFATSKDKGLHVFFIERSTVADDALKAVARRIVAAAEAAGGDAGRRRVAGRSRGAVGRPGRFARGSPAVRPVDRRAAPAGGRRGGRARDRRPPGPRRASSSPRRRRPTACRAGSIGPWDGRALALCRTSAQEGTRVRWRQYRSVWAWVEGTRLPARGDPAPLRRPLGPRADRPRAATSATRRSRPRRRRPRGVRPSPGRRSSRTGRPRRASRARSTRRSSTSSPPPSRRSGRTRAVEILRGGRSKVIDKYSYDGLPHYGAWSHLTAPTVLARVDALLGAGTLRSTGGRFPKLEVV